MAKGLKIFLIILLVLITLIGSVALYVYQNLDQLKKYAIEEVNDLLKAELSAKSLDITFVESFPKVSLALNEVKINDPLRKGKYLLKAQNIFLGFNIYDIFNKNYKIQLIDIDSGELNLLIDPAGRMNFDLLKEDQSKGKKSKQFQFELTKLALNRIQINYVDRSSNLMADLHVKSSDFSGNFSDQLFDMDLELDAFCHELQLGGSNLFNNKDLKIASTISVDNKQSKFSLKKGNFGINELLLNVTGYVLSQKKQTEYNLAFKGDKISIQNLLSTLPVSLPESMLAYKSEGLVFFEGAIKGIQSSKSTPSIKVKFGIENGALSESGNSLKLERINLNGSFDNRASKQLSDAQISIPEFSAELAGSKISGNLYLKNFQNPLLDLNLNGNADLNSLHQFFKFSDVKKIIGQVNFSLTLRGSKTKDNWDWSSAMNKGLFSLKMEALKLNYLTKPIENIDFTGNVSNNNLLMEKASLNIGESDFTLNGQIPSFMNFLFQKNFPFKGVFQSQSKVLNTNDLFIYDSSDPREEGEEPLDYLITLKIDAHKFTYDKFIAQAVKAELELTNNRVNFSSINLNTCGGNISGNAEWISQKNQFVLKSKNQTKGIQMAELLKMFNNFGQEEFTSKNLSGLLTAQTELLVIWDAKMNLLTDKVVVLSEMSIKNGELINYEPLNSLSRFVDVNDLKNLKFSEIKNTLAIQNKVLTIPAMDMKNNALNLTVSGTHTFENVLDYNIKLSLSELLSKKRKPQPNEFGEEDVKTKGINLYLSIKGPLDKLKFTFDRKGAKEQLKQDIKVEKENIKEILKQEFGIKKDTTLKKIEKKNDNPDELEFEPE
ncbi:MAG: AsmA family protein [Bacteroidia bacterium]|nr:AsmA family protein [Bacteroidia bacterium]MCF8427993.1 AsmA family protein [Bacteroidia bacterium]MCF8445717.1 AsmA family protein [Bacteroidia bacterium]